MESLQKISERLDAVRPWRRVDWEPSAPKGNVVRFRAGKNDKHNVNFPCSLIVPLPDYSMFLDVLVKDYEQYRVANSWVEIPDKYINKLVVDIDKCESETERDKNIAVVEDIIINMIKRENFLKPTTDDQVPSILVVTRGLNAHIYSNLATTRRDLQEFADAVRPSDRIDNRVATGGSGMSFFFSQKEVNATGDLLPDALYKPACFKQLSMDDGKWVLRADLMPSSARELLRFTSMKFGTDRFNRTPDMLMQQVRKRSGRLSTVIPPDEPKRAIELLKAYIKQLDKNEHVEISHTAANEDNTELTIRTTSSLCLVRGERHSASHHIQYVIYARQFDNKLVARQTCLHSDCYGVYCHIELEQRQLPRRDEDSLIEVPEKYLYTRFRQLDELFPHSASTFVVKAITGSGKTDLLVNFISSRVPKTAPIWLVCYRKSLIEQLRKKLRGFVCYNESKNKWVKSDRLIITPNSLIKTKYNRMPIPPVLIFDEVESEIATVFGKTMAKDRVASVDYLKELLTKVSVVIASDASAGSLTLETLRAFRHVKFHYILSTYQKPLNKRYKVRVSYDENAWRQGIIDRHRKGLVQFTHANSLEYAEKLAEELDDKDRVRVITSNTPWQEVRKLIEDIDELVDSGGVTHIVYSPKIEAGVSWNTKKYYCINAQASDKITSPPALMQSIVRVREPITGIINLCLKEVAPTDRIMLRPVLYQEVKQALEDGDCSLDEFCLKQELKHFPCMQHALVLHTMNKNEYYNDYEQTLFRLMHENQMTILVDIGDRRTKAPATEASSRYESRRADDIFNAQQISDDQVLKRFEAAVQASQDEVGNQDSIKRYFLQLLLQHNESLLTAENIREFAKHQNAIRAGLRDTLKNKCLKLDESQVSPGKLIDLYMLLHKEVTGILVARKPEKRIRVRCGGQPWSETFEIEMNMRQFRFYNAVGAEVAAPSQKLV
eukprot:g59838.t1